MGVSIIIPTYNYQDKLYITLKYLFQQAADLPEGTLEVIVIDDGSSDQTREVIDYWYKQKAIRFIIHTENAGLARSRNDGARAARFDQLLFLDSDIVMSPGIIESHLDYFMKTQNPKTIMISNIYNFQSEVYDKSIQKLKEDNYFDMEFFKANISYTIDPFFDIRHKILNVRKNIEQETFWLFGSMFCASMHKQIWETVGGFDENFKGWGPEDIEFSYRARKAGADFVYNREAICFHLDNQKKDKSKLFHDVQKNVKYFYGKHPNKEIRNYLRFVKGDIPFEEYLCFLTGKPFKPEQYDELSYLGVVKYLTEKSY